MLIIFFNIENSLFMFSLLKYASDKEGFSLSLCLSLFFLFDLIVSCIYLCDFRL